MKRSWHILALAGLAQGCWLAHEAESAGSCGEVDPILLIAAESLEGGACPAEFRGALQEFDERTDSVRFVVEHATGTCAVELGASAPGLASALMPGDLVEVGVDAWSLHVREVERCPVVACPSRTMLFARAGNPAFPESPVEDVSFDVGSTTCGPAGRDRMCGRTEFSIAASLEGAPELEIAPREIRELGPYRLRNVAALNDTCEDSGPHAVWVAWRAR